MDVDSVRGTTVLLKMSPGYYAELYCGSDANAAYIAAANPSAVLALLDDNDRLRAALDEILGYEITSPEGGHEEVAQIHRIARAALAGGEQ